MDYAETIARRGEKFGDSVRLILEIFRRYPSVVITAGEEIGANVWNVYISNTHCW